ncbi:MAG: sigma-54 interaction domain-containing protein, partial [Thermodesulfobacteriota bacterium]
MKKPTDQNQRDSGSRSEGLYSSCKTAFGLAAPCCTVLESISDGVFTVDFEKRITFFNRAAEFITGFMAEEAIGQYCFDIFRANTCHDKCPIDAAIAGHPQISIHAFIINKSGEQKPVCINSAILKDAQGGVLGGVETFRDLSEIERLRRELSRGFTTEDIVGNHPKIREILSLLPDIAESDSPVLIEGPTGSGKELFARAIHNLSPRKEHPFIAVNCAALPETLLESELFGYSRGAFTGAMKNKPGRFLLANKGTLFLDEIGTTLPAFQADLLRVLEDGEFMPLGETKALRVDVRVVAASNVDLKKLVSQGRFREDLYYRLNVVKVSLPPLHERKEDIPLLIDYFIQKFNLLKGRSIRGVTPDVLSFLMDYPFPGNIRQLENVIQYAFIRCKSDLIAMEHLPEELFDKAADEKESLSDFHTLSKEAEQIRSLLNQYRGNRIETAKALGISRSTLWRKIKKYGLV